jgi:alkaline phosphatase
MTFSLATATWILAGVSAASAVSSADSQRKGQNQAKDQAKIANAQQEEATNRANRKSPDSAATMAAAILAGKSGQSGTMLTGPQGVDPNGLMLGKATLLGG